MSHAGPGPVGLRQWLGSLLFTGFFLLWTFLYGIFFWLASLLLPFRGRFALARVWSRVILLVLRWTCRLDYRVEGSEHIPAGNHVALIKHSSSWETVAQTVLLPPQVWVLKRELTWIPFVGWGMLQLRAIAVDRRGGPTVVREVVQQGKARLAEGEWVVFFPEGTRMPPGETRKYGSSGAALAAEAERGYDLSLGRRRGRPSLDQGVSPRVTFRISGGLQERARERAEREGKSLSELARDALTEYVK